MRKVKILGLFTVFLFILSVFITGDEGMWLFNQPPVEIVKKKYGFTLTPQWLDHFRLSSARLGGSSAFVSPDGLVLTNHHVGADVLIDLSTKEKDFLKTGFYARTKDEELKCPDWELLLLKEIEDVTSKVLQAVKPEMTPSEAEKAKKKAIADIEKESSEKTGLKYSVVKLYAGNMYHLYKYKIYKDVRLVFAPEENIAFFGGHIDNFDYPRHCLDICFFRIYENGKPLKTSHYLKWSQKGPKRGELVFLSGNPASTSRFLTYAHLEFLRDVSYPYDIERRKKKRAVIYKYGEKGPEEARLASIRVWGLENGLKARLGFQSGLLNKKLMAKKALEEKEIREAIKKNPAMEKEFSKAWDEIAEVQEKYASFFKDYVYFVDGRGFDTFYFRVARNIIHRASKEKKTEKKLYFPKQYDNSLEVMLLVHSLTQLKKECGDHIEVKWILGNRSPEEVAKELISGTRLMDKEVRDHLLKGGMDAIYQSNDPIVKLTLLVEPLRKGLKARYEKEVAAVEAKNSALVVKAWLKLKGTSVRPPDASRTLRLSFGVVKGFVDKGEKIPYQTTFKGLYKKAKKHENKPPYKLPPSFVQKKRALNLNAGLNFVTTIDAIGGNSGSPCVNKNGEFVGVLFDINPPALANKFIYDGTKGRSILVHSQGIIESLLNVYDAKPLVDELLMKK